MVEYDPAWPEAFVREARRIADIVGENLVTVFHIGSTSIPGLKAKPIIDMLPVALDIAALDERTREFATIGYEAKGEFGIPGRRYFRKGGRSRTHQIHAFQYDDAWNIARHVAFRDYLRRHDAVRAEYAVLKSDLARRYPEDIGAYCDGKDAFVKRIEREALLWFWKVHKSAGES